MLRMKKFKSIMLGLQAQSKSFLNRLYVDHYSSDPEAIEDEKVFTCRSLGFWFQGTGRRNAEKVLMMIALPTEGLLNDACEGKLADGAASVGSLENDVVPVGTYLLGKLEPRIQEWNENNKNDNKAREKAQFFVQKPGNRMLRRSGLAFDERLFGECGYAEQNVFSSFGVFYGFRNFWIFHKIYLHKTLEFLSEFTYHEGLSYLPCTGKQKCFF